MRQRQRGAAVIVAILIVTLATSTAAFAVWQQSLWVRQLENLSDRAKADQLATSAIDVARDALNQDKEPAVDHPGELWASPLTLPAENATASGVIVDQQGLFNLNSLVDTNGGASKPHLEVYERLLKNLQLPEELAKAAVDWIDTDQEVSFPGGAEDGDYLAGEMPYVAANRLLVDVAELYRVKGYTAEFVAKLAPFVTALPTPTPINVNSAPAEVLAALTESFGVTAAKAMVERRQTQPFQTPAEFNTQLTPAPTTGLVDVKSSYFQATVIVRAGRVESGYTALLRRTDPQQWPVILWRKDAGA